MKFDLHMKSRKLSQYFPNPRKKKGLGKKVLLYLAYFALILCFLSVIAFAWFSKDLPTPAKIANRKPTVSTKIYDRTGETLIYETGEQKRTIVKGNEISNYLKDATVATEDAKFYKHHGIDMKAIAVAVVEKVSGRRRTARGGSTITQQYIKNALLTSDRSIARKIKEAILSVELEFMFSKDEILTMYLNEIPYGNATAGAEAAAKTYYAKEAKDLTLAEAATLAAIPNAPTYYSPYGTHVEKLIQRRNYVLDQMVKNGKVTQKEADEAKQQDSTTVGVAMKPRRDSMLAPHFAMYVLESIADEYGEDKIQKEGLKIITTLDYDKQKAAEEAIASGVPKLSKYNASNAALVAVDPKNGQILTMVGSKDYFDVSIDGNVNVADSLRQPGSSFKPFAYATAFKKPEYSPSKILYDFQTNFGGYVPHNYNGKSNGPVSMRTALSNSLNIPAVKVMALAGIDNVLKTASDMGITTLTERDRYGLSLVLGSGEVKPVEMAGAYSVFANGGTKYPLAPVLKISDSKGKVLYDFDKDRKKPKQALDPQVAYEISSILSDNNARSFVFGANSPLHFPNRVVAAKTGTTNDFKDAWAVGYTPSIAVAVWTGNSNATKMKAGADGSVIAAPIFHSFIEKALVNQPSEDFVRPDTIKDATVEKYSNKLPSESSTNLVHDIFASWQVPKDADDVNVKVRICKASNLLAPDSLSESMAEFRTYTNLHSEKPDNPNWENPVRAWATSANLTNLPPKDYCDPNQYKASISITSPLSNDTISEAKSITAAVNSSHAVQSVEFFVDNVSTGVVTAIPYTVDYDFSTLSEGIHKISALLTTEVTTAQTEISINYQKVISLSISNLNASISDDKATITWVTNEPATSQVAYKKSGDTEYTMSGADSVYKTSHSVTIKIDPKKKYYYRAISVDEKSKSVTSAEKSFNPPN